MLEVAFKGDSRYWGWIGILLAVMAVGGGAYMMQLNQGLTVTDLSRDVSWGFYIAQFTYLVGVAAAGVMVVLPYYFHNYKAFSKMIILAEFQAVAAVIMCLGFIVMDLGMPMRLMNVVRYPTPGSILFWDMVVLNGYLFLNIVIGWVSLQHERNNVPPPSWVKPLIYASIVWAFSIHTVTAFLYQGLPGRGLWFTAILAARFLASAFCSGPAILLLVSMLVKRVANYDVGREATMALTKIITYAMIANLFFFGLEVFTAYYSNVPSHYYAIDYLFAGFHGETSFVTYFMWFAAILAFASLAVLIVPKLRENMDLLPWALGALVLATWIDKGLGLLIGGFTPNPFKTVTEYVPTVPELLISMAIYATGALVVTILYKVAVTVKKEVGAA